MLDEPEQVRGRAHHRATGVELRQTVELPQHRLSGVAQVVMEIAHCCVHGGFLSSSFDTDVYTEHMANVGSVHIRHSIDKQ